MLAGLPGALDDLAREQAHARAHEVAQAAIALPRRREGAEERRRRPGALGGGVGDEQREERLDANEAARDHLEPVDDVDADAVPLEVVVDDLQDLAAGGDVAEAGRERGLDGGGVGRGRGGGLEQLVAGARELVEGGIARRHRRAAHADVLGEAERGDPDREQADGVAHGAARGRPQVVATVAAVAAVAERGGEPEDQVRLDRAEPAHLARAREQAREKPRQILVVGRLRQEPARQAIADLVGEAAIVRQPDLEEEPQRRGLGEHGANDERELAPPLGRVADDAEEQREPPARIARGGRRGRRGQRIAVGGVEDGQGVVPPQPAAEPLERVQPLGQRRAVVERGERVAEVAQAAVRPRRVWVAVDRVPHARGSRSRAARGSRS